MNDRFRRSRAWIIIGAIYCAFFYWYTSFGGPLTDDEIAEYEARLTSIGGNTVDLERVLEFMRSDTGDDFAMFNAIDVRDVATPVEGLESGASGREALARYSAPFFSMAAPNGAHPVMLGSAASRAVDIWGIEGADVWDQGALVRYRSRRDLMTQIVAMAEQTATGEDIHSYKIAGLNKTIAFPLDPWFQLGDPRLVLALALLIVGLLLDVRRLKRAAA